MKKLFITLAGFIFITACATVPIQNPVCPQEDSWICERSAQLGIQPEQVYGWIYDASAMGVLIDAVKIQDLCDYEQEVADWYLKVYPISYDSLITNMLSLAVSYDPQKTLLIKSMLNRNFIMYSNSKLISTEDDIIFRKGHGAFRQDMLCY